MRNIVSAYVDKLLRDRRVRLRFGGIVLLLAFILMVIIWRLVAKGIL